MSEGLRPITWGVIGSGAVAQRFAAGIAEVPGARIDAVWGRNKATAGELAAKVNGVACTRVEELLDRELDSIYIATLPDSHARYSLAALAAGKHVLCEKPVTRDAAELGHVLTAARSCGRLFMEAMKSPFFPLYRRLRQQLEEEPIGPIRFVRAGYATASVPAEHPSWRLDTGGGGLLGIGVYQAFLAVDWLGAARTVQTAGQVNDAGVDVFACLQTEHAMGGFAQLFCGLDLHGPGDAVLAGTNGNATIHAGWWNPVRATVRYKDGHVAELDEPATNGLNYETEHFCELVRRGDRESPVITHEKSMQVMLLLDQARAALGVVFPKADETSFVVNLDLIRDPIRSLEDEGR